MQILHNKTVPSLFNHLKFLHNKHYTNYLILKNIVLRSKFTAVVQGDNFIRSSVKNITEFSRHFLKFMLLIPTP